MGKDITQEDINQFILGRPHVFFLTLAHTKRAYTMAMFNYC